MITLMVLCAAPARGLEVPVGWTTAGPDRALMVPSDPGRGELREFTVPGGRGRAEEVVGAL